MALQQTALFENREGKNVALMGVEWDDVTLQVSRFAFRLSVGNRDARFTLMRISDGATVSRDFIPGVSYVPGTMIFWNPPFAMAMLIHLNTKLALNVGVPDNWTAKLALL